MERQMTGPAEITFKPSVSSRFLALIAAAAGGVALLVAILVMTGSGTDLTAAEFAASDGVRWQAIADNYQAEASQTVSAQSASAARLAGLAASLDGTDLTQAHLAAAARWAGVAGTFAPEGLQVEAQVPASVVTGPFRRSHQQ